ncbi:MAG: phosphohydrolase, partial [Pedobacter sp.]
EEEIHLQQFSKLDDQDIYASVKVWADADDVILSKLCKMLNARKLYKVEISNEAPDPQRVERIAFQTAVALNIDDEDLSYFVFTDTITNRAYNAESSNINILMKNGSLSDIAKASDLSNLESLDNTVKKHILCYVRDI